MEGSVQKLAGVEAHAQEVQSVLRASSYAQRAEYITKTRMERAEIRKDLLRSCTKVDSSFGLARSIAKVELSAVRERWAQATRKLDDAEDTTELTWNDVKR